VWSRTAAAMGGHPCCRPHTKEFSFLREFHILSVLQPRYARLTSTWKPRGCARKLRESTIGVLGGDNLRVVTPPSTE